MFRRPIPVGSGEILGRAGFVFAGPLPATASRGE